MIKKLQFECNSALLAREITKGLTEALLLFLFFLKCPLFFNINVIL